VRQAGGADKTTSRSRSSAAPDADPILEHRLVARLPEHASQDHEQIHDTGERGCADDMCGILQSLPRYTEDGGEEQYGDERMTLAFERVDRVGATRDEDSLTSATTTNIKPVRPRRTTRR